MARIISLRAERAVFRKRAALLGWGLELNRFFAWRRNIRGANRLGIIAEGLYIRCMKNASRMFANGLLLLGLLASLPLQGQDLLGWPLKHFLYQPGVAEVAEYLYRAGQPASHLHTYRYDEEGRLRAMQMFCKDSLCGQKVFRYENGRLTAVLRYYDRNQAGAWKLSEALLLAHADQQQLALRQWNPGGVPVEEQLYTFDPQGRVRFIDRGKRSEQWLYQGDTLRGLFRINGKLTGYSRSRLDPEGRRLDYQVFNQQGETVEEERYAYDAEGHLITRWTDLALADGFGDAYTWNRALERTEYHYDAEGHMTSILHYELEELRSRRVFRYRFR
jgi:hypothetical protein